MKQKQSLPWRVLTEQKNLECSEDSVICRFELAPPKRPGPEPGALDLSAIHPLIPLHKHAKCDLHVAKFMIHIKELTFLLCAGHTTY